mmetsp:Transcript_16425/g.37758  ORF Transcript_16425/g.37758 Transcript_16425/m.37758 type:complete len:1108 (+) Transcript_16425:111-3434(+)
MVTLVRRFRSSIGLILFLVLHQAGSAVVRGYDDNGKASRNTNERIAEENDVDLEKLLDELDWTGQVGQMVQMDINMLLTTDASTVQLNQTLLDQWIGKFGVGSVLNNNYLWKAADYRREVIRLQQTALKYNRPPVIWGLDSVHGANYVQDALVTPQPINLAASFNNSISYEAGKLASKDTRRAGIPWLFSPLLGLSWNPYWSRVFETFGEDPLLVGEMAQRMIEGIQAADDETDEGLLPSRAAACAKHFVGYSNPHNGHDRAPSQIPMRHLYQHFMLPWRRVLRNKDEDTNGKNKPTESTTKRSRPMTVMESYTEIDGVPNVANRRTLDKMLRKELGFTDGMLVTDYNEITNLERWHHLAADGDDAVWKAMSDGTVDMSMIGLNVEDVSAFFDGMNRLLFRAMKEQGRAQKLKDRVRESARRVLRLKRDLNMFRESFQLMPLEDESMEDSMTKTDVATVLDMTRQSIILTKNENKALPLMKPEVNPAIPLNLLVTGPTSNALSFQTGGWTGEWQGVNSNYENEWFTYNGYRTVLGALQDESDKFDVKYECGVDSLGNDCSSIGSSPSTSQENDQRPFHNLLDMVRGWIHGESLSSSASTSASSSDVLDAIVICLGEENYAEKPGDITDLKLPQGQYDLVTALKEVIDAQQKGMTTKKTKIILVYFGGRPRLLADVVPLVDAVIVGFLPGPFAGNAIADFLTGRANPSARLPITYPKHQDLSGIPYLHEISDMCTEDTGGFLPHMNNVPCDVQWPFGHGLSFTKFEYGDVQLSTTTLQQHWHDVDHENSERGRKTDDEQLSVTVSVTNSGDMAGAETILFFTFDESRSTTPEYKRLRGYEKVWLEPGESKDVRISISLQNDLRFVGPHDDSHYILQDGLKFRVGIGSDSDCRRTSGSNSDDGIGVCSEVVTIRTETDYVGACEAACNLWKDSGDYCVETAFPPKSSTTGTAIGACRNSCTSIHFNENDVQLNNDGWGWNYVKCLESIVQNDTFDSKKDCWKLTSLCRDVTHTLGMDEFGSGMSDSKMVGSGGGNNGGSTNNLPPLAIMLSLFSGIFASVMIIYTMRDGFDSPNIHPRQQKSTKRGKYGNVEFLAIDASSNEMRNNEVC